jgi:hypothetical protein
MPPLFSAFGLHDTDPDPMVFVSRSFCHIEMFIHFLCFKLVPHFDLYQFEAVMNLSWPHS